LTVLHCFSTVRGDFGLRLGERKEEMTKTTPKIPRNSIPIPVSHSACRAGPTWLTV